MELQFEISDLPLVIENGIEAGLIEGLAVVSYDQHGDWGIKSIYMYGYKKNDRAAYPVKLDSGTFLESLIRFRLEHDWRQKVQDEINAAVENDRESDADDRADMRREYTGL